MLWTPGSEALFKINRLKPSSQNPNNSYIGYSKVLEILKISQAGCKACESNLAFESNHQHHNDSSFLITPLDGVFSQIWLPGCRMSA